MSATPAKQRSPNYPAISLAEAIDRLKRIYAKQKTYPATREIIAKSMGYGGLNGASASVVSALSKYGLLEGHGERLHVSALGQDLALHRKGDPEYTEALQTAAFMPTFFRELRDQYPHGLPTDHLLRANLIKRGFNPKAVDSAVRAYRDTMEFVDAETGGSVTESPDEPYPEEPMQTQVTASPTGPNRVAVPPLTQETGFQSYRIPISPTGYTVLQGPFPLTKAEWDQMEAVIRAMKPVLVTVDVASADRQDAAEPPTQSE